MRRRGDEEKEEEVNTAGDCAVVSDATDDDDDVTKSTLLYTHTHTHTHKCTLFYSDVHNIHTAILWCNSTTTMVNLMYQQTIGVSIFFPSFCAI